MGKGAAAAGSTQAEGGPAADAAPAAVAVRRALLSVSDKRGIVEFARGLAELGVELVSTGGTAAELERAGIAVRAIDDYTGFPEIMDGRVKTLHPKLYAGLLAVRDDAEHMRQAAEHEIEPIDLVCVNLYPFEQTIAQDGVSVAEAVEQIDIGGPTMVRAAAKNHAYVAVVVAPESYDAVLDELRGGGGALSFATRERLAAEAFACTARYDAAIARWFAERGAEFPATQLLAYEKQLDLPYGENPHQRAAYYAPLGSGAHLLSDVRQLHGKELSFNNLLDLAAARRLLGEFDGTVCVIVKHNNPCGCALGESGVDAYRRAFECDPLSAFGGVIAVSERIDHELAVELSKQFIEVLIAPGYDEAALALLQEKPNVRLLEREGEAGAPEGTDLRSVAGGLLVQDADLLLEERAQMAVQGDREPTEREWADLLFAWRVCKHVRSNAIVIARDGATAGIGAGQTSRVDSVRIALEKSRLESLAGTVLASDAFFPFADGVELAIEAGVSAIIQPGGSVRDEEVFAAAAAAGVAMVTTGHRHFRH